MYIVYFNHYTLDISTNFFIWVIYININCMCLYIIEFVGFHIDVFSGYEDLPNLHFYICKQKSMSFYVFLFLRPYVPPPLQQLSTFVMMRAVQVMKFGGPEVLKYVTDLPIPTLAAKQVCQLKDKGYCEVSFLKYIHYLLTTSN